jgi:hypothetical protein
VRAKGDQLQELFERLVGGKALIDLEQRIELGDAPLRIKEQPSIVDRDRRLVGDRGHQLQVALLKIAGLAVDQGQDPDHRLTAQEGDRQRRTDALDRLGQLQPAGVRGGVHDQGRLAVLGHPAG